MLAFEGMLVGAAKEAGMKVPPDPNDFDPMDYPHFRIFCNAQLGRATTSPNEHWQNAKTIAAIPDDKILTVTLHDLVHKHGLITTMNV